MRNQDKWMPTKFVKNGINFKVTSDTKKAGIGYRLVGEIQAKNYYKLIKQYASGVLLDLGCGDVALYEMYKSYSQKIYCIDWPNTSHDSTFLDFQINLNKPFPMPNGKFDTIILTDVLEHISNPDNIWAEMTRVLKPGGKIIVGVPFFHILHEEPFDYFRYTEFRLRLYCDENKLKILELYPYGGSLEIFFDFTSKHLSRFRFISKFYYIFATVIINSFIGKKIFNRTSSKYPMGYCLVAEK